MEDIKLGCEYCLSCFQTALVIGIYRVLGLQIYKNLPDCSGRFYLIERQISFCLGQPVCFWQSKASWSAVERRLFQFGDQRSDGDGLSCWRS